ncbi:uncharacterized protein GGS22DRAFT_88538 [Annulohypoxylon maeteangense]|uniref:uncharacterized protein n=1 Tax=Annulohypoxylon maeteangense TaxID=1927788 RepID=UPI002008DB67|nr:uncharacterized protein GGS22DRAFT_88538 [Annulohypoxylon maeteangense]KAI0887734.1 hypothetical protein GGS22DRAFT_88538 [Annulohypoxylon maeteangense]
MSTDTLRLLLPRLLRSFSNHGHGRGKNLPGYTSLARSPLSHPQRLNPQTYAFSSMAQSPGKVAATNNSSMGKAEDSHAEPTSLADDGAMEETDKKTVAILWDLDNKTPSALPEGLATTIRSLASRRGKIIEYSAMANYCADLRLPPAAIELRKQRKLFMTAEARGQFKPAEPYRCPVCQRKCATQVKLEKHYKQLHERELRVKQGRLASLGGKKREKWLKDKGSNLRKRIEAHAEILNPEAKHKVFKSLTRAGVLVRVVQKKPQAADKALIERWKVVAKNSNLTLILISDDSDFCKMAQRAKMSYGVYVIVVSENSEGKLAGVADEWWSWDTLNNDARDTNHILLREALTDLSNSEEGESDGGPGYVIDDDLQEELFEMQLGNENVEIECEPWKTR